MERHTQTLLLFLFGSTTVVGQDLPVPLLLVGLAFSDFIDHSKIVNPKYGGTVHMGFEPMTGMLLSRTS